jgi:peptidoglycan/LPS O-acetylase OafA/YrhL
MELKYRPDIDGLRAIAVLAVLFFHTSVPGFSGGFVGVDVFFVISGFLITSIILKDIRAERFSVARFYERRIRRIFPALFPLIAFVLVIGTYLYDVDAFKNLGRSIAATTLFSSNILFWQESGYFAAPSLQKPLLHTWSLAVEEQFYIFFPLALLLISRYLKGRYTLWIAGAFILSFITSILGVIYQPGATFYLVPTRAWELLAGSFLALRALPDLSANWQRNLFAFFGIALISGSIILISEATPFPGLAALPPVLGTSLVIYSGMGNGKNGSFIAQRMLSARPLVFIGLISYSLYLWHWPLVAFWKYLLFKPWNGRDSLMIIVASIAFASLSWKFIEQPFRGKQPLLPVRKQLFAVSAIVMALAVTAGVTIDTKNGMSRRFDRQYPGMVKEIKTTMKDPVWRLHGKWEQLSEHIGKGAKPPVVGQADKKPSFAFVGDSHARAYIPAIEHEATSAGISGMIITRQSTPFLLDISRTSNRDDDGFDEVTYNNAILAFIGSHPEIKTVIIASRWGGYVHGQLTDKGEENLGGTKMFDLRGQCKEGQANEDFINIGLKRSVDALLAMHRQVVLVTDVPEIGYDVPRSYYFHVRWPSYFDIDATRPSVGNYHERQKEANAIIEALAKQSGVSVIHPENLMFDEHQKGRIIAGGKLLYRDGNHLSTAGALYVAPAFAQLFKTMAVEQSNSK